MKKIEIENLKRVIEEEEKDFSFNDFVYNYIDQDYLENIEDSSDLEDYLQELNEDRTITEEEVIYYSNAIEYLSENDNSLKESLDIAQRLGYTIENINSELLASLLISEHNLNDYEDFIKQVINREDEIFKGGENE